MKLDKLIGKTIKSAVIMGEPNCDDAGVIRLGFECGDSVDVVASWGNHTGKSLGEYPTRIYLNDCDDTLVIKGEND